METDGRTIIISTPEELFPLITEAVRLAGYENARNTSDCPNQKLLAPKDVEREFGIRQRESLTHRTNTSNADSFSLISYIYRKIPEPEPDRFYRLSSLVAYPFSYPFFASRLLFPQEYTVVIENKNFSEKSEFFSDVFLFVLRTELLLAMCPTWSEGVFFIYGHVLLSSVPDALPRIRAPPLVAPYSGQTPEASPALLPRLCVMPTFE